MRLKMGLYQHELAHATGISIASYRRLERGELQTAPLWWYVNCAIALNVDLEEVLDQRTLGWRATRSAPAPPGQEFLADRYARSAAWADED
jgi:transcriptional regulator with XRE-family HTH domain